MCLQLQFCSELVRGPAAACLVHCFDCYRCSDPRLAPDREGLPRLEQGRVGVRLRARAPRPDDGCLFGQLTVACGPEQSVHTCNGCC